MSPKRSPDYSDWGSNGGIEDEMAASQRYASQTLHRYPVHNDVDVAWNGVASAVEAHPRARGLHPEVIKAELVFFKELGAALVRKVRGDS